MLDSLLTWQVVKSTKSDITIEKPSFDIEGDVICNTLVINIENKSFSYYIECGQSSETRMILLNVPYIDSENISYDLKNMNSAFRHFFVKCNRKHLKEKSLQEIRDLILEYYVLASAKEPMLALNTYNKYIEKATTM